MLPGYFLGHVATQREREFFIDNLSVRIHLIIEKISIDLRHGSVNSLFQIIQRDLSGFSRGHNASLPADVGALFKVQGVRNHGFMCRTPISKPV